ncbi:MAG TPA: LptA/OstA family protein [Alphaproteobacteria bacterium]
MSRFFSTARVSMLLALVALGSAIAGDRALGQPLGLDGGDQPIEIEARDGIEWDRKAQRYIARGDARAKQGDTTVDADTLTAFYRQSANAKPGATSRTEIYRYQADGNVRIATPTHRAVGDRAIYDVDTGVIVLTGSALRLTTPTEVVTARDALEYWEHRQAAVARGDALVVTQDGRRLRGDLLTAYFTAEPSGSASAAPARAPQAPRPGAGSGGANEQSRLQRIEAFGNVHISTETEIAVGDRGVYNADTGIAVLAGNVRITRGQNQLNGDYAEVNMNTGVSRLLSRPDGDNRVRGLFVPESRQQPPAEAQPETPAQGQER